MTEQLKQRMTAAEFLQLPETKQKMELIEGEIIVPPAPVIQHQRLIGRLSLLVDKLKPDGQVIISPSDVEFDIEEVYQPDVFWVADDSKAVETQTRFLGAPDLVVEVLSPGTAKYDRGKKFNTYEKFGVREYWMADPDGAYLEVWVLDDKKFTRLGVFGKQDNFDSLVLGKNVVLIDIF